MFACKIYYFFNADAFCYGLIESLLDTKVLNTFIRRERHLGCCQGYGGGSPEKKT